MELEREFYGYSRCYTVKFRKRNRVNENLWKYNVSENTFVDPKSYALKSSHN